MSEVDDVRILQMMYPPVLVDQPRAQDKSHNIEFTACPHLSWWILLGEFSLWQHIRCCFSTLLGLIDLIQVIVHADISTETSSHRTPSLWTMTIEVCQITFVLPTRYRVDVRNKKTVCIWHQTDTLIRWAWRIQALMQVWFPIPSEPQHMEWSGPANLRDTKSLLWMVTGQEPGEPSLWEQGRYIGLLRSTTDRHWKLTSQRTAKEPNLWFFLLQESENGWAIYQVMPFVTKLIKLQRSHWGVPGFLLAHRVCLKLLALDQHFQLFTLWGKRSSRRAGKSIYRQGMKAVLWVCWAWFGSGVWFCTKNLPRKLLKESSAVRILCEHFVYTMVVSPVT